MQGPKEMAAIRKRLSHLSMKWRPTLYLDTGIELLNNVLGHPTKGLAYGHMVEVSGWESQGKSALTLAFAALAQRDGAHVIWGDFENSFTAQWAIQRGIAACPKCLNLVDKVVDCPACGGIGVDTDKLTLIAPYVGVFGAEKESRLATAQELLQEMEEVMGATPPDGKCCAVVDTIAALLTEGEEAAGLTGGSLRSNMDLPMFVGRLLRRWAGKIKVHNTLLFIINQLRTGPAKFGADPTYSMGGNGPKFYSHVRVRVKRTMSSRIMDKGRIVGIKGTIKAIKNKAGGEEFSEAGYKLWYRKSLEFVAAKDVKTDPRYAEGFGGKKKKK